MTSPSSHVNTVNDKENSVPERVQMTRNKPWRDKHPDAVIVDRRTPYGNPFRVGDLVVDPGWWNTPACPYDGGMAPGRYMAHNFLNEPYEYEIRPVRDCADAVDLFRAYVDFHDDEWPPEAIRRDLGDRDLACWCALPEPGEPDVCHGAVLLAVAAGEESQ